MNEALKARFKNLQLNLCQQGVIIEVGKFSVRAEQKQNKLNYSLSSYISIRTENLTANQGSQNGAGP